MDSLIGRRWDSLSGEERGSLPTDTVMVWTGSSAGVERCRKGDDGLWWNTTRTYEWYRDDADGPAPDNIIESIPGHASPEVAETRADDRDREIAQLRATIDSRNAEITALSSERMDLRAELERVRAELDRLQVLGPDTEARVVCEARELAGRTLKPMADMWRAEVVKARAAGMEEAAKVVEQWARSSAEMSMKFPESNYADEASLLCDCAKDIRERATNPRASGEEKGDG